MISDKVSLHSFFSWEGYSEGLSPGRSLEIGLETVKEISQGEKVVCQHVSRDKLSMTATDISDTIHFYCSSRLCSVIFVTRFFAQEFQVDGR